MSKANFVVLLLGAFKNVQKLIESRSDQSQSSHQQSKLQICNETVPAYYPTPIRLLEVDEYNNEKDTDEKNTTYTAKVNTTKDFRNQQQSLEMFQKCIKTIKNSRNLIPDNGARAPQAPLSNLTSKLDFGCRNDHVRNQVIDRGISRYVQHIVAGGCCSRWSI